MKSLRIAVALCLLLLPVAGLSAAGPAAAPAAPKLPPRPTHDATAAAQKKVDDATVAYNKANSAFGQIVGTLRKALDGSPEWADATAALNTARVAYEAAQTAVVTKLQNSPDFAAAAQAKTQAETQKDTVLKNPDATPQQRTDAANGVMDAGRKVTALQTEAMAADPKFVEAKKNLADASAKIQKLVADFDGTVKDKPEWQSAKQDVQTAETDLKTAKAELVTAQQADAAADAAWKQQVAEITKKAQSTYKK